MTERHHYKYIILDSSKENGNAVQAKFNVQIPHGITNASRVCVKSFSMPNVIHNVYGGFKNVRFVEFYRPTAGGTGCMIFIILHSPTATMRPPILSLPYRLSSPTHLGTPPLYLGGPSPHKNISFSLFVTKTTGVHVSLSL